MGLKERINFRNFLAAVAQAEIIGFWTAQGLGVIQNVPGEVNGALIAVFTLIFQFYFRKKPKEESLKPTET